MAFLRGQSWCLYSNPCTQVLRGLRQRFRCCFADILNQRFNLYLGQAIYPLTFPWWTLQKSCFRLRHCPTVLKYPKNYYCILWQIPMYSWTSLPWPPWGVEESGRCKEVAVVERFQTRVNVLIFCPPGRKKGGHCREVAISRGSTVAQ